MNELHQNQDLKTSLWDWWRSRIYICDNTSLWMKKICKLKVLSVYDHLSYYRTCLILIVILQQYWSVSIKKLFISFKLWLNGVTLCFAKLFLGIHDILGCINFSKFVAIFKSIRSKCTLSPLPENIRKP